MSLGIWLPVLAQFGTCATFQVVALALLRAQPWYEQFDPHPVGVNCFARTEANSPECSKSWENSVVFIVSLGQFLATALVFNKGPPHRRSIYTNVWLLLALLFQSTFVLFLVFNSGGGAVAGKFAGMVPFPASEFRWKVLGLLLLNLVASYLMDQLAVWGWQCARGRRLFGRLTML
jgi:cation-transporting P-type ATPase 13A2